ncbi:MAG: SDR family NAD(P)-dependent oxidoreductase [Pseudomonadota bacterium]
MTKTIMITGSTDGIGFETAKLLARDGHTLLLHGRNAQKLEAVIKAVKAIPGAGTVKPYQADLSNLAAVAQMAEQVGRDYSELDVLINNAGVFVLPNPVTKDGYDLRFIVNTIAPYVLTKCLLPLMSETSRVVNLSSAAQAPVDLEALSGNRALSDGEAYAQSKLAITMWSFELAMSLAPAGPTIIAVNPASFLGSKMVKEAYGREGHDLSIGAEVLVRASLSDDFASANGQYFDNDRGQFSSPHPDALSSDKNQRLVTAIEQVIAILDRSQS